MVLIVFFCFMHATNWNKNGTYFNTLEINMSTFKTDKSTWHLLNVHTSLSIRFLLSFLHSLGESCSLLIVNNICALCSRVISNRMNSISFPSLRYLTCNVRYGPRTQLSSLNLCGVNETKEARQLLSFGFLRHYGL